MHGSMDVREFRNALGRFPTGVAVVAVRTANAELVGLTVNSVACVAHQPARLAWSLGNRSRNRAAFDGAEYFAVNILAVGQIALARQMSAAASDRFDGLAWTPSPVSELPFFPGSIARFDCRCTSLLELGDHVTYIGDIVAFEEEEGAPLLYSAGRYAHIGA